MNNTTNGLNETFTERIGRVRIFKVKAASKEIQAAFQVLTKWQGKTEYFWPLKLNRRN